MRRNAEIRMALPEDGRRDTGQKRDEEREDEKGDHD
jgi:hypothetical protein